MVSALVSRGPGAEASEEQVEQLVDKVSKLVGGQDAAKALITRYQAAATKEDGAEILSHFDPDVAEVLEQVLHLEGPVLKMLAYIANVR